MKYQYIIYDAIVADGVISPLFNVYQEIFPDATSLNIVQKIAQGEVYAQLEITGTMKIIGDDFDAIMDHIETPFVFTHTFGITITQNANVLGIVYFDPFQTIDYDNRTLTIKVTYLDQYAKINALSANTYNIAGNQITKRAFNYVRQSFLEEVDVSFANELVTGFLDVTVVTYIIPPNGDLFSGQFPGSDPWTNWSLKTSNYTVNSNPNCGTYEFDISGTATFYRFNKLGNYKGGTANAPTAAAVTGWVKLGDIRYGNTDYPIYIDQPTVTLNNANGAGGAVPCDWTVPYTAHANTTALPTPAATAYAGVLLRVDDTIKYLLDELDARIQFDNTGTATDSFYGFKSFVGETLNGSNKPFENFAMMGLSNFIPDMSGGLPGIQKSNLASKLTINWKELMTYLKSRGFYWLIEIRTTTPYFRLYHKTQIALLTNNPNLGDWQGYDYRIKTKNYKYEAAEYYRLRISETSGNREFIGTDLIDRKVRSGKLKELTSTNYFTDTEDIYDNGTTNYDDESTDGFIPMCCWINGANYEVRESTGFIINQLTANGEMSAANLLENLLVEVPFGEGDGNEKILYYTGAQLRKRKQIEMKIPIENSDDFELISEIQTINGESAQIEQITHDFLENEASFKLIL